MNIQTGIAYAGRMKGSLNGYIPQAITLPVGAVHFQHIMRAMCSILGMEPH